MNIRQRSYDDDDNDYDDDIHHEQWILTANERKNNHRSRINY